MPLLPGEAERFEQAIHGIVPAERLARAVVRNHDEQWLQLDRRECPALDADRLCVIHARRGPEEKPTACNVYPFVFVRAPDGDEVHLSWSCPAVVDREGPALTSQREELEHKFAVALQRGFVAVIPEQVKLSDTRLVDFRQLRQLLDAIDRSLADGTFVTGICRMTGLVFAYEEALDAGVQPSEALVQARTRAAELTKELMASPPTVDWRSRWLFRSVLLNLQSSPGRWRNAVDVLRSVMGRWSVRFRDGKETTVRSVETVLRTMPEGGDELLSQWFRAQVRSLTFFGPRRFDLSVYQGLDLLILLAAIALYLARAHAAACDRTTMELSDLKAALLQIEGKFLSRSKFLARFGPALRDACTVDLLREQLQG